MSFHWNLSSDEEDENEEFESKLSMSEMKTNRAPAHVTPQSSSTTASSNNSSVARMPTASDAQDFFFSDDEDEDEVDWEDADSVGSDELLDAKLPANNTHQAPKPVTIDMNAPQQTSADTKKKKKRSGRRIYRFHSLPPHLQSLLLDIQHSHLLTLSSRAIQISQCCSNSEVLHVAYSLVPNQNGSNDQVPTQAEVREFVSWYTSLVNQVTQRRRRIRAANEAAGAPTMRQSKKRKVSLDENRLASIQPDRLLEVSSYLSPTNEEHHHLLMQDPMELSNQDKVQLLVAMARSKGWRARYVTTLDPVGLDLDVDHPLFAMKNIGNVFRAFSKTKRTGASLDTKPAATDEQLPLALSDREFGWVEILCKPPSPKVRQSQYRWMHVDPSRNLIDRPNDVESLYKTVIHGNKGGSKATIAYVLAVEHLPRESRDLLAADDGEEKQYQLRLTDVTPRYANSWSQTLRLRTAKKSRTDGGDDNAWWTESIKAVNRYHRSGSKSPDLLKSIGLSKLDAIEIEDSSDENGMDDSIYADEVIERGEKEELITSAANEAIPTSKAAFNNHPIYAIQAVLNANEVFAPDAKDRICGIFKGTPVYRRNDVHTAITAKKWLYEGRKVKDDELRKPVKRVKARKKPTPKGFQALHSYGVGTGNDGSEEARQRDIAKGSGREEENDGMQNLYAIWQTLPWSPIPVGPNDPIPTNEYKNIELKLLNPGLVHLDEAGASKVAKKLGIPYAPCLLGFEGHGGNRTPSIRGIIVHEHNIDLLREAHTEFMSSQLEREHEKRTERIRKRWKKLIVGLLTKERLEREYGGD